MARKLTVTIITPIILVALLFAAAFANVVAPGAEVKKLADGFKFTEGPAADKAGNVYFTDIPNEHINVWTVGEKLTTFLEDSGGANGLYFDKKGNLLACEGGRRRVVSIAPDGTVSILANNYAGKKLNSPNDLWPDPKGGIYFTDPRYGGRDDMQQDGEHVYYISPDRNRIIRVVDNMVRPNGIIGSADGKRLYITDHGDQKTYVYSVKKNGMLGDRKLIAEIGSDGMTLDENENLYLTAESVLVYNRDARKIATIETPERPANVTFGGPDNKTLFITARTGLYAVKMSVAGQ